MNRHEDKRASNSRKSPALAKGVGNILGLLALTFTWVYVTDGPPILYIIGAASAIFALAVLWHVKKTLYSTKKED